MSLFSNVWDWINDSVLQPMVDGVSDLFGGLYNNNSSFKNAVDEKYDVDSSASYKANNPLGVGTFVGSSLGKVVSGVENWWNKNTGNAHLTPEYQHEEELSNTSYQRAAADMEAAGLSKFGGVNVASSPSPKSGNGVLSTMLSLENLKNARLANKVETYNFNKAKQWGVPTSAVNDFAKYDAISQLLFGKPLHDFVGSDGLISLISGYFNGFGSGSDPIVPAASDALEQVLKSDVPVFENVSYLGENKDLENVLVPSPVFFGSPEAISALKVSLGDKISYSPTNVMRSAEPNYQSHILRDVDKAAKKMLNDDKLNDDNINRFSEMIAKHYGYDMMDVRKYFDEWLKENKGEVLKRW